MYYIAADLTNEDGTKLASRPFYACYAESKDGIRWVKPELGLFEFEGSKQNNIVWAGPRLDNFTPFKDPNPDCRPGERYKASPPGRAGCSRSSRPTASTGRRSSDEPIITKGAFDTQNNAFWDPLRKHYWCYIRDFHNGIRDIRVATSPDFRTVDRAGAARVRRRPDEPLYTNQVRPYDRAPHLFVGFPTRYVERRVVAVVRGAPGPGAPRRG